MESVLGQIGDFPSDHLSPPLYLFSEPSLFM